MSLLSPPPPPQSPPAAPSLCPELGGALPGCSVFARRAGGGGADAAGWLRRGALPALLLAALVASSACGGEGSRGGGGPAPRQRLSELLQRGAQPGELEDAEREEIETLVLGLLPAIEGPLAGHRWRVAYDDLPVGDFLSIDLVKGDDDATADRPVWLHLVWRGALAEGERAAYAKTVGRFPARGVDDHHLFVRAGNLELRAVADSPEYRDPARLRAFVESFDLDALAAL